MRALVMTVSRAAETALTSAGFFGHADADRGEIVFLRDHNVGVLRRGEFEDR